MESAQLFTALLLTVGFFIISILIIRLFGAWMLRINEVIRELKEIKHTLKHKNNG